MIAKPRAFRSRRRCCHPLRWAAPLAAVSLILIASGALADEDLTVHVSPERARARPGQSVLFSATVHDAAGEVVAADVTWSVIPLRAGVIGSDGRFEAGDAAGPAIVRAVATYAGSAGAGHAAISIGSGPPSRLAVTVAPSSAAVALGGVQQFEATVTDPLTGEDVDADTRWVVVPERLGSIDQAGLFTPGSKEGSGRIAVRATSDGREGVGDAAVVVGSPPESGVRVRVVPAHALLAPGEELEFDAAVADQNGDPIEARVEWSVMPRRLGVVDETGLFTAGADESVGRLVATVATREGPSRAFAVLEIRRPGPAGVRIRVRPREAAVTLGGDVKFEALVAGPEGEPLDVAVDWVVRPSWLGTIGADGLFTASDEMPEPSANGGWVGAVVASIETHAGVASDAARVLVQDTGPSLRLRIHPHRPVIAPGQDVEFEANVIGAGEPLDWTTEWAVFPGDLGTITPDGLFSANPVFGDPASGEFGPHEGVVGARVTLGDGSVLTDRAHVRVRIPGQPVRVRVTPVFAVVPAGQTMAFDAIVVGPDGEEIGIPVSWHVRPERLGTVSPDGIFTAAEPQFDPDSWDRPRGTIIAEARVPGGQAFRGAAVVVVDMPNPQAVVRISPRSVTLAEGESFGFEAEAATSDGTPIDLTLEWRVADPVLGAVDGAGLFTASIGIPHGHTRRTTVLAGGVYNGRLYWDFATVHVTRD